MSEYPDVEKMDIVPEDRKNIAVVVWLAEKGVELDHEDKGISPTDAKRAIESLTEKFL